MTDMAVAQPRRSRLGRLRASLRQLKYPREFRIAPAAWPIEAQEQLQRLATMGQQAAGTPHAGPLERENGSGPDPRALAAAATGLWRLRMKMLERGTTEPLPQMRQAFRHLESIWDALAAAGFEIQDHDGMPFETGLSLSVIEFQPTRAWSANASWRPCGPACTCAGAASRWGR